MVDAYQDITIPFQMSSEEFFTLVEGHLTENGVMVVNMNMRGGQEGNINQYLADTISGVFDTVYTVDVAGSTNRELFASNSGDMRLTMEKNVARISDRRLSGMMKTVLEEMEAYQAKDYRMTDDKAPVELLGMQVIDELIFDEVSYYKDIFKREGFGGLLKEL